MIKNSRYDINIKYDNYTILCKLPLMRKKRINNIIVNKRNFFFSFF